MVVPPSVPILLHSWGVPKYGDWVVLSAVPGYLSLSDLGFGNAASSDMTIRVAANDREGALRTFQSSWALLTFVSLLVITIVGGTAWTIPWSQWFRLSGVSDMEASQAIIALGGYILMCQQSTFFESSFRCEGHFAVGTFLGSGVRICEAICAVAVAVAGGSILGVALAYFAMRSLGTIVFAIVLAQKSPWIRVGIRSATWTAIKHLALPALGFVVFPLSQALSMQGATIIVGALIGPLAVTSFSTIRTLTRLNFQAVNAIARVVWPELSAAFGSNDIVLARQLHRRASQAGLALSLLSGWALWITGPWVYRSWLHGGVAFDASCFHILLAVSVVSSFWYTSFVVPMSTNGHQHLTTIYFIVTCIALIAGWFATRRLGITGMSLTLLFAEAAMVWVVLRTTLRQLGDSSYRYASAMVTTFPATSLR